MLYQSCWNQLKTAIMVMNSLGLQKVQVTDCKSTISAINAKAYLVSTIEQKLESYLALQFILATNKPMILKILTPKALPFLYRPINRFGSYYQTVKIFSEVQETPGIKDKLTKLREFKNSLSQEQQKQFYSLLQWCSNKVSVRLSSKLVSKYYLKHHAPSSQCSLQQLAEGGGVMKKLCKEDKQSELSLFDVNLFLNYLWAVEGKGSQGDKIKKIIQLGENVSLLEGTFLLKLIERKLTIGVNAKSFRKLDQIQAKNQKIQQIPLKLQSTANSQQAKKQQIPQTVDQPPNILSSPIDSPTFQQEPQTHKNPNPSS